MLCRVRPGYAFTVSDDIRDGQVTIFGRHGILNHKCRKRFESDTEHTHSWKHLKLIVFNCPISARRYINGCSFHFRKEESGAFNPTPTLVYTVSHRYSYARILDILTGSGIVNGVVQTVAEHDVIEDVDYEAREEQVSHVEHRLVVLVRHGFVHERVTPYEVQYGI